MQILIGSDGNNLQSLVSKRFGLSNYFIVYDSDSLTFDVFENSNQKINHENIVKLINKGVQVFLVGNIGPHAFEMIKSYNKKIFLARNMKIDEAIQRYLKGELKELSEPTVKKSIRHNH